MNLAPRVLLCLPFLLSLPAFGQQKLAPLPPQPKIKLAPLPDGVRPGSTPKPHPAIPTLEVPGALGVNIHFTDAREGELEMMEAGGFRVARMDFAWSGTEKAKGVYDFLAYDRLIKGLEAHHIQPLFILDYANDLYDEGLAPHTEAGRAAFAKWAASAAAHFKGHKVLWEMYNEPNGDGFWKPKENVNDYIQLALATGRAIRASAPGECYIGPATSGVDFRYLDACFKAGLLELWDAVSVHPYRQSEPETVNGDYRTLRLMIERYKPKGKTIPILSGEWGYSSAWKDYNDERQGKYLPRQWMTNLMNGAPVSIWYDWHDDGTDPKEGEHHFGTTNNAYFAGRTPVYDPKPSYIAARTFTQFFKGLRFNKRVALYTDGYEPRSTLLPDDYLLLFSNGQQVKFAVWTTGAEHSVTLPSWIGACKAVNYLGEEQPFAFGPIIVRGTPRRVGGLFSGRHINISDSPLYLEPLTPSSFLSEAANVPTVPLERLIKAPTRLETGRRGGGSGEKIVLEIKRDSPPTLVEMGSSVGLPRSNRTFPGLFIRPSLVQLSQAIVANPLSLVVEPSLDKKLLVRVENPMGVETKGKVTLNGGPAQTVSFADRETEKNLTFSLPRPDAAGSWGAKVRFTGRILEDFVETSSLFVPLDGFRALTNDNLATSLAARADGNPEVKSEQTLSVVTDAPEPAPNKGPILKLTYQFSPGWKFANVQPSNDAMARIGGNRAVLWPPKHLGMWVYGDGTGNLLRMRWSDSTGQTFQLNGTAITWKGWRYVRLPIEPTSAHWGGANDGVIHGKIKVETLFLLDAAQQNGTQGEIYVCAPSWIY